ncbi:MAG: hypothetical protein JXR37_35140 [Kiritimatiellae bacterium]|nr:hypothetical protein [Kiritimatiellia bacterium]
MGNRQDRSRRLQDVPARGTFASRSGRILRLKTGYNPNSSSIGSLVFVLSVKLLAGTAAFGAVAGMICSAFMRGRGTRHGGREQERSS